MTPRLTLHLSLCAWLLMAVAGGQGYYYSPCQNGQCPPQYAPQQQQPRYAPQPQGVQWSDSASDVLVKDNNGFVGSGTVVHSDGQSSYVLTNHHVIREGQTFVVHSQGQRYSARVVDSDQQNDLAVLRIEQALPAVTVGEAMPRTLTLRSYDHGREFKRRTANVKGDCKDGSVRCGAVVAGGSSGGGCYDAQGRLVGVIWGCRPQDRETYLTPIGPVRRLLVRIGCIGAVPAQPPAPVYPPAPQPQQPPQRDQVQLPPCKCDERWDAMAAKWKAQVDINKDFDARIAILESSQSIAGATGPQGPQGPPGRDGKDATADPALQSRITQLEAELTQLRNRKIRLELHKDGELIGVSEGTHTVRVNINELEN